jgi:flagellar hook-associated protein 3
MTMQRISTLMQFAAAEQAISARQRELLEAQRSISSGRRIAVPSDDPIGAATGVALRSGLAQLDQFKANQSHARFLLNQSENAVAQVADAVLDARDRLLAAANGSLGDNDRLMLARDLEGVLARMVALANSADGIGGFLFAGASEGAPPFAFAGAVVSYSGDGIAQRLEVDRGRLLTTKFTGDDVFLKIRAGNGTFVTAANSANAGSGWIDAGRVTDPSALTGSDYEIEYNGTQYVVTRASDSEQFVFAPGSGSTTLQFDGLRVTISGAPATGDRFEVQPAGYRSIFDTMSQAIAALKTSTANAADRARALSLVGGALASIDQAHDHFLLKRAEIGASLAELDGHAQLNETRNLELQGRRSDVEDVDYGQAVTLLARRQASFEAAIKSYSMVSRLSLFDYL